jgi:hypothetical protein
LVEHGVLGWAICALRYTCNRKTASEKSGVRKEFGAAGYKPPVIMKAVSAEHPLEPTAIALSVLTVR